MSIKAVAKQVPKQLHDNKTVETIQTIYNVFYDSEIEKNNDENYKDFVKFLFGKNGIDPECDYVLSLKHQITFERYNKLKLVAEANNKGLFDTIRAIENRNGKKYISFYYTLNNWLKQKMISNVR